MRLYIVKEGDTLSSIADKYGLELEQLLAINPQITDPDAIMPGMKIKIAAGPVPVLPDAAQTGHPFHQSQPQQQTDTPFMQVPVPSAMAGQTTAQSEHMNMLPSSQASSVPNPLPSLTESLQTQSNVEAQQNQAYLSTIPQHFSGNPMYSGVGPLPSSTSQSSAYQANPSAYLHTANTGMPLSYPPQAPQALQAQAGQHSPANAMHGGAGALSAGMGAPVNIHAPYNYPGGYSSMNVPYPYGAMSSAGTGSGWHETYTWSTPFAQLAMPNSSMFAPAQSYMPANKKPCGCGKSNVGYYSLAEKKRMENDEAAQAQAESAIHTDAPGNHAARDEQVDAQETTENEQSPTRESDLQVASQAASNNSQTKRSKSRSAKRSRTRKGRSNHDVQLHAKHSTSSKQRRLEANAKEGRLWINVWQ